MFLVLLCGCSSGNSIVIDKQASKSSLRLTDDALYIDPALLGLPQGTDITVHTSPDDEMTFNVEKLPRKEGNAGYEGSAF